jgi:hypothetical protein
MEETQKEEEKRQEVTHLNHLIETKEVVDLLKSDSPNNVLRYFYQLERVW